jgi:hypothetical protein
MRNTYTVLIGKTERNRQLRRLSHRLENNIKIDLKNQTYRLGGFELNSSSPKYGPIAGSCEHGS